MKRTNFSFVHAYKDRHGKKRLYLRLPGKRKVALPGPLGSAEFIRAYQAALNQTPGVSTGVGRSEPGTVSAAVASYVGSTAFSLLADETRRTRKNILERFRLEHGHRSIAELSPKNVQTLLNQKARTPSAARNFLATLRSLITHCMSMGLVKVSPVVGVKSAKIKSDGYYTWTEEDIARFEERHPVGTRARLAFALLLYTAQRRSDIVTMGRQHLENGFLRVKQSKTGTVLLLPMFPELTRIIDATPSNHLTFLTTLYGNQFTPAGFTNWFRDKCNEAGLPKGVSAHGLRKAACRRLAEAGCSASEIMSISGHKSLREVQRYVEAADQQRMASAAMSTVTLAFPIKDGTSSG